MCGVSARRRMMPAADPSVRAANLVPAAPAAKERAEELAVRAFDRRRGYLLAKRAFDIAFSAAVIVVLLVPCLLIALAIFIDDPSGSPIFVQRRVGKNGHVFRMLKFRTMSVDAEELLEELRHANEKSGPVFKIRDDPRITRVGRVLRRTSIDELPQFVNVLLGSMSVVGPRPALPAEVACYSDRDRLRLLVKPGITCYWQTMRNRDDVSFDAWVDSDLRYIETCSMWTDIKLVARTVGVVLTAQGV